MPSKIKSTAIRFPAEMSAHIGQLATEQKISAHKVVLNLVSEALIARGRGGVGASKILAVLKEAAAHQRGEDVPGMKVYSPEQIKAMAPHLRKKPKPETTPAPLTIVRPEFGALLDKKRKRWRP